MLINRCFLKTRTLLTSKCRLLSMFLMLLVCFPLFSQNDEDDNEDTDKSPIISQWSNSDLSLYTKGDQLFWINLGLLFPLFITDNDGGFIDNNIKLGGIGSLKYSYFLTSHIFIGGELQGSFSPTLANLYYVIPISFHGGFQFVVSRFEFPFSLSVGGASQIYANTNTLYGLFLKATASAFFRLSPDWSLGLNGAWWMLPQFTNTPEYDATGNFFELTLSARYHF
ncbi:MAG: hypothetical protein Ta2B_12980 [Termitinemataceae bacterium]|nr:MAG: hypothetical protein Ta2B_12980 [Termitinemataceae bacterium]